MSARRAQPLPRATLRSVAAAAGVSHAAVSLILNGRARELGLSRETERRVRDAAKTLNYIPNQVARSLRTKSSRALGVYWLLGAPHESAFVRRLMLLLQGRGYLAHLVDDRGDFEGAQAALDHFALNRVEGLIFYLPPSLEEVLLPRLADKLASFRSVTLVARDPQPKIPFDLVLHDDRDALRAICRHFRSAGRRRPAVLAQTLGNPRKNQRLREEWASIGDPPDGLQHLDTTPFGDPQDPVAVAVAATLEDARKRGVGYDALITYDDATAAAALAWLRAQGVEVPSQVAVTGFNNNPLTGFLQPPLASVDRASVELASAALDMVFARLEQPGAPPRQARVPMRFLPRASVG